MKLNSKDVLVDCCSNKEADTIFHEYYWLKRVRRSRKLSYVAQYNGKKVAWVQCADPFGTKLAKPLQSFDINETIELCRGYFIEDTPPNMESCVISKVINQIANDWYTNFKVIKKVVIVYQDLDANQRGIVYKASGFIPYAKCGRARHYSVPSRGNLMGNKIIWARKLRVVNGLHYKVRMPDNFLTEEQLPDSMSICKITSNRK